MKKFTLSTLLLLLLLSITAYAQTKPHVVDKSHSQINFIGEARFISAHGFFDKWEADVMFDPASIESSSFKITIEAASINTRVQRRDDHLRSKDFFEVEKYPQITLVSKKVSKIGDQKYNVTADLTLHGVTKEIDVPISQVFYENNRGRFRANFEINRRDFGITFNSKMNPIEDIVKVQVDINILEKESFEKAQKARAGSN
ncbi:MAG: YceI family protein [Acidobacteria bacterium]|nr:YceI family protein [Acidobacteriota bacterium]